MSEMPSTSKRPSNARSSGIPRFRRSNSSSSLPRNPQHISRQSQASKPRSIRRSNSTLGTSARNSQLATPRTPRSASTDYLSARCSSVVRSALSYSAEKISKNQRIHKDSRPLQDQQWQKIQQKKVQSFFQDYPRGRDILNNGNTIKPITPKMFVESCDFLLKMLDHRISITTANYMDELPLMLKKLRYPATVPKSLLSSVNIPRSWPSVLAILSWLIELVQMSELVSPEMFFPNVEEDKMQLLNKMCTEESVKSYLMYMDSLDYEPVVDDLVNESAKIYGSTDEETAALKEELKLLQAQIQKEEAECAAGKNELKYYEQKEEELNQLDNDIKLLTKEELEFAKSSSNFEKKEKQAQEMLEALQVETASLDEKFKNQPVGHKSRDSIVEECKELEQFVERKNQVLSHQKEILYKSELKMAAAYKKYNELAMRYTTILMNCSLKGLEVGSLSVPDLRYADPELMKILSQRYSEIEALEQQTRLKIKDLGNTLENSDITQLNENLAKRIEELEALESREAELKLELSAQKEKITIDVLNIEKENEILKNKMQMTELPNSSEIEKEINELGQRKAVILSQTMILCEKADTFFKEVGVIVREANAKSVKEMAEITELVKCVFK